MNEIRYLNEQDIARIGLPAESMMEIIERTLRAKKAGKVEMPAKLGVHPRKDSFLHAMPGYIQDGDAVGMKWISYYPDNQRLELPAINGLIVLNDAETGRPEAILDGNWITAYRTAAVSAYSSRLLQTTKPTSLGLIGYGVQAASHLDLFSQLFNLKEVSVWGPNPERCHQFVTQALKHHDLRLSSAPSAEHAVRNNDLVVSVIPIGVTPVQTLRGEWIKPGAVVCPVEFDSAWDRTLFQVAQPLVTDDLVQFEIYRKKGFFKDVPTPHSDLASLIDKSGSSKCHNSKRISVAVNLGIGLLDIAFAQHIYANAQKMDIGLKLTR